MHGKRAIITGGSKGIGLAIAKAFAVQGAASIALVGRSLSSLEQAKAIVGEYGKSAVTLHEGSVGDRDFWLSLAKHGVGHSTPTKNFVHGTLFVDLV
jgi:NAD(P)-dependent dehydrogenase (short-subunit alcohol dehydrogenase family)